MANKTSQIIFDVELDENHVPEKLEWKSTDNNEGGECDAALMSIWDSKDKSTLKIDLWSKNMTVDNMNILFHQTILSMSDTYNRATSNDKLAFQMKEFARFFGEETGIIDRED